MGFGLFGFWENVGKGGKITHFDFFFFGSLGDGKTKTSTTVWSMLFKMVDFILFYFLGAFLESFFNLKMFLVAKHMGRFCERC